MNDVPEIKLRYVKRYKDRHGRWRCYFRARGHSAALPADINSPAFHEAYAAALTRLEDQAPASRAAHGPGSFGALVKAYLASPDFKKLAKTTQREYRRVLEGLAKDHGPKQVRHMAPRHVRQLRDEKAETPGAANTRVRILKLLMSWAVEHDWREDNPATRVKLFKLGEWRPWEPEEHAMFKACWAPGTMQRRAYALALYTGQRRADLAAMSRNHMSVESGRAIIRVRQEKTGEYLWIPIHAALAAEIEQGPQEHLSLLTTSKGKGFDKVYFGAWFADAIGKAGLPQDCVLHGLRKNATVMLLEAGCTHEEARAITGHSTTQMIDHYGRPSASASWPSGR